MKSSRAGRLLTSSYLKIPARRRLLNTLVGAEGGQMKSVTLRDILQRYYGVALGAHSYGSLAEPGRADRDTFIGRYVSIGPDVRRFGASHPLDAISMHPYWYNPLLGYAADEDDVERTRCDIGHESWIGAGSVILPGCRRIGVGAVIGAASVVVSDVPDFAVVVGNPARVIKTRFDPDLRAVILDTAPWQYEPDDARRVISEISSEYRRLAY